VIRYTLGDLAFAIRNNKAETIRDYLEQGGDPSAYEYGRNVSLLHVAAERRNVEIVKMLLAAGAEVNRLDHNGRTPLFEALEEPVRPGGGVGPSGFQMPGPERTPLPGEEAANEIVRLLVDAGANLEGLDRPIDRLQGWAAKMYKPPLALAAQYGKLEALRFLLERGADPNGADYDYMTVLHYAVHNGQVEAARILIAAGANLEAVFAVYSQTPLLSAIYAPDARAYAPELVRLLVESGADINKTDKRGDSPLFWAVNEGRLDLVQLLIELGADVHHQNPDGLSALAYLVRCTHSRKLEQSQMAPIVATLLAAGVDPAVRNKEGKTPRDMAQQLKLTELEPLL
jgi:ankyrin repeat protein